MARKRSSHHKPKISHKHSRLRDLNIFTQKEKELFEDVPQHFLGISDQQLGRLFENAWALVEIHEGLEAVKGFRLLCNLHPYVSDFWYGLAHALKESGDFVEALEAYIMAETMEPSRFEYYQEAIVSAIEAGKKAQAKRIYNRMLAHKRSIEGYETKASEIKQLEEVLSKLAKNTSS